MDDFKSMFDEWFDGWYGLYSMRSEYFYEELGDLEDRRQYNVIYRWMKYAFEAGMATQKDIDKKTESD